MKKFFTLVFIATGVSSFAQYPLLDSWMLNTTGTLASYDFYPGPPPTTNTVNMTDSADVLQICEDADWVYIRTNGLASYHMGPWAMNPNEPLAIESIYRFPKNPAEETGTKEPQPTVGAIGVAVNGVKLYGAGDARSYNSVSGQNEANGDGLWNGDAWASEGPTMDASGAGHADQNGNYHYHATPIALYDQSGTTHSAIVAWAFDGYPIYGPYGYSDPLNTSSSIVRIETSYQLRSITDRTILPDGSTSSPAGPAINATFPLGTYWEDYEYVQGLGHLDEYNGRFCYTPDFPNGTYAYFITMDGAGEPQFPYLTGLEYYGVISNPGEIGGPAGNITIPGSAVCGALVSVEQEELTYEIYPNPANDILNVKGINGTNYQIHDQTGRLVDSGIISNQIDISSLSNGTYILSLERNGATSFEHIVKQ